MDVDHIIYGFWFFLFVIAVYIGVCWLFAEPPPKRAHVSVGAGPASPRDRRRLVLVAAVTLLAAMPAPLYAALWDSGPSATPTNGAQLPSEGDGWRRTAYQGLDWRPAYVGVSDETLERYRRGADTVDLYIGRYSRQHQGGELVSWGNSLAGDGWEDLGERLPATLTVDGQPLPVRYVRLAQPGRQRVVFYWYRVNGVDVSSDMTAKLEMTKARLFQGDRDSAVIALATDGRALDEAIAQANALIAILPRGGSLAEAR